MHRTLSRILNGAFIDVKGGYYASATPHPAALADGLPVELGSGTNLAVLGSQQYRVIENPDPREPWQVRTVAYHYTLREIDEGEILSYQWYPNVPRSVTFPHLHLKHRAMLGRPEFERAHLPTGRVTLEDFVRLLIVDFGIPAVKEDWEQPLEASRAEVVPSSTDVFTLNTGSRKSVSQGYMGFPEGSNTLTLPGLSLLLYT